MNLYCAYYEQSRTHLSLNKDTPIPRCEGRRDADNGEWATQSFN
jgi:hypothetical protein